MEQIKHGSGSQCGLGTAIALTPQENKVSRFLQLCR
jgi:hypothetical protein